MLIAFTSYDLLYLSTYFYYKIKKDKHFGIIIKNIV